VPRISLALAVALLMVLPAIAAGRPADFNAIAKQTSTSRKGNATTFTETLRAGRTVIGHDRITCTLIAGSTLSCRGTFDLTGGTLRVLGRIDTTQKAHAVRIVGGGGRYNGARGTLVLRDFAHASTAQSFHFR
jgi:uncharacterized protein with beta-barrel porin domain